jgi:hypothetical protein
MNSKTANTNAITLVPVPEFCPRTKQFQIHSVWNGTYIHEEIKHGFLLVLILGVKCKSLSVDQLLHLFFTQCMLLEIKAEGSHADRFITDVMQRC